MKALNEKDSLNLSALQMSMGTIKEKKESKESLESNVGADGIDWENFDLDQIPEDIAQ